MLKLFNDVPFDYPSHSNAHQARNELIEVLDHLNAMLAVPGGVITAIKGDWGSGKTSMLRAVESYYRDVGQFPVVFFEAWKYQDAENPLIPLLQHIHKLTGEHTDKRWRTKIRSALKKTMQAALVVAADKWVLPKGVSVKNIKEQFDALDDVKTKMLAQSVKHDRWMGLLSKTVKSVANDWKSTPNTKRRDLWKSYLAGDDNSGREDLLDIGKADTRTPRMVLIIDDLDRCLPPKGFALLEAVRFHLAVEGVLTVMGVDDRILESFIEKHYGFADDKTDDTQIKRRFTGREFLDKVFQWSHELRYSDFAGIEDVLFDDVTLHPDSKAFLSSLAFPYRTWVRIWNRVAQEVSQVASLDVMPLWLAVAIEQVPSVDHKIRQTPGLWRELKSRLADKKEVKELLEGVAPVMKAALVDSYSESQESL